MSLRSRRSSARPPRLRPEDLADDSLLGALIDGLLVADARHVRLSRKILAAQGRLQELSDDDAHFAYLSVEEFANERVNLMLLAVARWAFGEGRRQRRR
jgi:hypothetical protein